MLNLTGPRFFIPVHGEYRHLQAHASLAQSLGMPASSTFVLENGDVLEFTNEGGRLVDRVPAGHVYVDGRREWNVTSAVLKERKAISRDGILFVAVTRDRATGMVVNPPKLISRGFVDSLEANELYPKASQVLVDVLDHGGDSPKTWASINSTVRDTLGEFLYQETGRRPMIIPVAVEQ